SAATLSRSFVAPLHCNGLVLFLLIFALTATLTHPGSLKKDARRLPLTKLRTAAPEFLAQELAQLVRLKSGAFPDDIAIATANIL
ncbi:MAG TPA: hypothetical protein VEH04_00005, partial [Verrucomicrobiae bacterium]|nr:hypothetical protein [Verrucomicrobiae bacterium]